MSWDTTTSFTLINYKQTRAGNKKKLFYFVFENKVSPVSIIPGNASFCLDSKIATAGLGLWKLIFSRTPAREVRGPHLTDLN